MRRVRTHLSIARNRPDNKTHKYNWIRTLIEAGLCPLVEVVQTGSGGAWADAERDWIKHYRDRGADLTNVVDGGRGIRGFKHTQETRRRMSESAHAAGRTPSAEAIERARQVSLGRVASNETRLKMSAARKGKCHSREWVEKRAQSRRGKKFTPEQRMRLSQAHKGIKQTAETIAKRVAKLRGNKHQPPTRGAGQGIECHSGTMGRQLAFDW